MNKQHVELSIINQALNLHPYTPITSTLSYIGELIVFRQQHEECNSVIFTLKDQMIKIKLNHQQQVAEYLKKRIQSANLQSQKLFNTHNMVGLTDKKQPKCQKIYSSLDQFLQNQYDLKVHRNKHKIEKLKVCLTLSEYYLPERLTIKTQEQKSKQPKHKEPIVLQIHDCV